MWLIVSRRYISIYFHLFLHMFVGYLSVTTCLILLASLSCFWNPITQKFAAKLLRACPWSRSRYPDAPFGSSRDPRVQQIVFLFYFINHNCKRTAEWTVRAFGFMGLDDELRSRYKLTPFLIILARILHFLNNILQNQASGL